MSEAFDRIFHIPWKIIREVRFLIEGFKFRNCHSTDFIIEIVPGLANRRRKVLCLFAHFDPQGRLSSADRFQLQSLENDLGSDIVFCSTNINLDDPEIRMTLQRLTIGSISRRNQGYDFGSWKTSLDWIGEDLFSYSFLLLVNNSVIGPASSLKPILDRVNEESNTVLSMTQSFEREFHLQSYFLWIPRKVFRSRFFADFWRQFRFLRNKKNIVYAYELGLSRLFSKTGVSLQALYPIATNRLQNPTHFGWRQLLENRCPFVKRDLVRSGRLSKEDLTLLSRNFPGLIP